MNLFEFKPGNRPFMISCPHSGTSIPEKTGRKMTPAGKSVQDTDWFLPRLYDFQTLTGVSWISSNTSRYVVDLNRSESRESLYPGQKTTGLCPTITFDEEPIYESGREPDDDEIGQRTDEFWRPYHNRLRSELDRLTGKFGEVVLLDVHSIASRVPMLFEGQIPDFNFGTNNGATCSPDMQKRIDAFGSKLVDYTHVSNGRFVGGHITRNYGATPKVHSVQLELSQATYLDESDMTWNDDRSDAVAPVLRSFVEMLLNWVENK